MANVKFDRKEFEKHIKINENIKEKIALFGTPLESLTKDEIELEIFPNRPDLLSLHGFLRSFKAFLGKKTGLKKYKIHQPEKNYEVKIDSSVNSVRPYTACCIIKGLKFDDKKIKEVIDIQEKIHLTLGRKREKIAIGIYPLEQIKLPIKYKAKKPENIKFTPLESEREMNARQILTQHPTGREYSHLLKGKEKFPVFLDSNNEVLSMPPIINSHKTGKISEKTTSVFIECSGFDFSILKKTLNILVTMLAEMGGKIYQMKLKYKKQKITPDLTSEKMKISLEKVNNLLGLNLKEKDLTKYLKKAGFNYKQNQKQVEIPSWRTDILHEVDLIEDIAISYGYEKFNPKIPSISTIGKENEKQIIKRKISEILTGLGLLETSSYHLITEKDYKKIRKKKEKIKVKESKTDYQILRQNLLISCLKILSENTDKEYPQKIFEIGTCFSKNDKLETGIQEQEKLYIALTPSNFTEIKQTLDYLFKILNLTYSLKIPEFKNQKNEFIEGRIGKIIFESKEIGDIGEIHPSLITSWNLKLPLSYLEINLKPILEKLKN